MNRLTVDLNISSDEYQKLYQGVARDVVVSARDGRSVRFPARILRPYLSHAGIKGTFVIEFDDNNKFQSVQRLN